MVGLDQYVTIATDVSSDHEHGITTWACYIRHDGGVIKHVAPFKEHYVNTALAETYALANALVLAEKSIKDWSRSKVIIYNEVAIVLSPCKTKAGNIRKRDAIRSEQIMKISLPILNRAKSYELRDIKAHYKHWRTDANPAKYAINRWCDVESRTLLRYLRRQKKRK